MTPPNDTQDWDDEQDEKNESEELGELGMSIQDGTEEEPLEDEEGLKPLASITPAEEKDEGHGENALGLDDEELEEDDEDEDDYDEEEE